MLPRLPVWLFVDKTMHAQIESILHATAAFRTFVGLRIARHVHQQFLFSVETTFAHPTLQIISDNLQQGSFQGVLRQTRLLRGCSRGPRSPSLGGLERAHVVDADMPCQFLDRCADLPTKTSHRNTYFSKLERRRQQRNCTPKNWAVRKKVCPEIFFLFINVCLKIPNLSWNPPFWKH